MRILDEQPRTSFTPPDGGFAPAPAERRGVPRDGVRLLVGTGSGPDARIEHGRFRDVVRHLGAGDALVVNDSATVAGQLDAWSTRHRAVVVHLATPPDLPLDDGSLVVEVRTAPDAARAVLDAEPGDLLRLGAVALRVLAPYPAAASSPTGTGNRLWRADVAEGTSADLAARVRTAGRPIAYGYLDRRYPLADYQTVFGWRPGSAEMPSAGRPFTADLVSALVARGVAVVPLTLHTGVSSQEAGEAPQSERFAVPETSARLLNAVRAGGGRVVAVGTTATRAVESAVDADGRVVARSGWTDRVVTPADPPRVVDGLITGWHDPHASHLLLVEAVAGRELTQRAYTAAVEEGYLWHEFGDSALLLPRR